MDRLADKVTEYDDHPEFNDFLDEQNPLPGKTRYSRALFDQEFETYEIELGDFLLEFNPEEE